MFPLQLHNILIGGHRLSLYVPEPGAVEGYYRQMKEADPSTPFPYWTQVWPAALAMSEFIEAHPHYVEGKQVLELAAGLGLPSLIAARYAQAVCCSDYLPEAVAVLQASVAANGLRNTECRLLDWHHLPPGLNPEVLILSDINYDPSEFDVLFGVLSGFLEKGTTILLSTPQRLMAKPFVEQLLPWCVEHGEYFIPHLGSEVPVTLFVLKEVHRNLP